MKMNYKAIVVCLALVPILVVGFAFGYSVIPAAVAPTPAPRCEVTWYKAKDHTVAANPRHQIPDGAYIKFTNLDTAPARVVIVRKRGHMSPKAVADFDLAPEAFQQLAPLSDGRLKRVEWQIVFP